MKGLSFDWQRLYGEARPRRISLPTYPFARERYWIERMDTRFAGVSGAEPAVPAEDLADRDVHAAKQRETSSSVEQRVRCYFSKSLRVAPAALAPDVELSSYGLDSIRTMGFRQMCEAAFGVKITAREMLDCPTVASITARIYEKMPATGVSGAVAARMDGGEDGHTGDGVVAIEPDHPTRSALSEGQKGLWALQKIAPAMSAYNIPVCFRILQPLDIEAFRKACQLILKHHPVLADAILEGDGGPHRAPAREGRFVYQEDISGLAESELVAYLRQKNKEPVALERGPLLRVHLLTRSSAETIVLIVIHHIAFDGGSALPFLRQLLQAYRSAGAGRASRA